MRHISGIITHCSDTRPDWFQGQTLDAKVKEIRRWHVQDRAWNDIGYHFVIDRTGEVGRGRPVEIIGAHTKGYNRGTIGICLIGGHGSKPDDQFADHFTEEQARALRELIEELRTEFGPLWVKGHNDFTALRACPGFRVEPWLSAQRPALQGGPSESLIAALFATLFSLIKGMKK